MTGAGGIGGVLRAGRGREAAEKLAADIDRIGVPLDVTDPDSVAAAVAETTEKLGAREIVVNCAGWDELKPFLETDEDFTRKVIKINYAGPIRVLRATMPAMFEARWGWEVNVASTRAGWARRWS